jgi:hypothetical protein
MRIVDCRLLVLVGIAAGTGLDFRFVAISGRMIGMVGISSWDVPVLLRIIDGQSEEITALRGELAGERASHARLEAEGLVSGGQVRELTGQLAELTCLAARLTARGG